MWMSTVNPARMVGINSKVTMTEMHHRKMLFGGRPADDLVGDEPKSLFFIKQNKAVTFNCGVMGYPVSQTGYYFN